MVVGGCRRAMVGTRRRQNSTRVGVGLARGMAVAAKDRRWWAIQGRAGAVVRPVTRVVVFRGRIRGEEEEGFGDVGSSSNRIKSSTDPNYESQAACM